jgi:hypothetical protein
MPRPSKFTVERKARILELLKAGASRRNADAAARSAEATHRDWLKRGKTGSPQGRWREFYEQVVEAEAHPRMRALGIVYREMENRPDLAWKFIERREPGFGPMPVTPVDPTGPIVVQLSFSKRSPLVPPDPASSDEGGEPPDDEPPGA